MTELSIKLPKYLSFLQAHLARLQILPFSHQILFNFCTRINIFLIPNLI